MDIRGCQLWGSKIHKYDVYKVSVLRTLVVFLGTYTVQYLDTWAPIG